jgi:Immunity protein 74
MVDVQLVGNRWERSDDAYTVIRTDRFVLEYRENGKRVLIEVEPGIPTLAVYASSIKRWEVPFEDEALTDEDRSRILENIKTVFNATNYAYIIE